ncbi:MAG: hypothetical protein ABEJ03_06350 [Candidatus Nanohaloarchaea archaeon]
MSAEREILNIEAALTDEGAVLYELRKDADGDAVVDALGYLENDDYLGQFDKVGKSTRKKLRTANLSTTPGIHRAHNLSTRKKRR